MSIYTHMCVYVCMCVYAHMFVYVYNTLKIFKSLKNIAINFIVLRRDNKCLPPSDLE